MSWNTNSGNSYLGTHQLNLKGIAQYKHREENFVRLKEGKERKFVEIRRRKIGRVNRDESTEVGERNTEGGGRDCKMKGNSWNKVGSRRSRGKERRRKMERRREKERERERRRDGGRRSGKEKRRRGRRKPRVGQNLFRCERSYPNTFSVNSNVEKCFIECKILSIEITWYQHFPC